MAVQVIQRTGLRICREPGILEVALDQAATFQRSAYASGDLLDQCKSLDSGATTGRNTGASAPTV